MTFFAAKVCAHTHRYTDVYKHWKTSIVSSICMSANSYHHSCLSPSIALHMPHIYTHHAIPSPYRYIWTWLCYLLVTDNDQHILWPRHSPSDCLSQSGVGAHGHVSYNPRWWDGLGNTLMCPTESIMNLSTRLRWYHVCLTVGNANASDGKYMWTSVHAVCPLVNS